MSEVSIAKLFPIGARVVVPCIISDSGQTEFGTIVAHMKLQEYVTGVKVTLDNGRWQGFEDSTFYEYLERMD